MDPEALFRFRIVSAVELFESQGHGRTGAVRLVAAQNHDGRTVSRRTIWRWLKVFDEGGIEALAPKRRATIDGSRALSDELLDFLATERERDRDASVPELIRRARHLGHVHPDEAIDRTTVWRAMKRLGLATRPRRVPKDHDTRRFAYPERLQMVLLDFVHFRAGFKPALKRCAIYVIDDCTRKILGCAVTTAENADTVLHTLARVLRRFGKIDRVYCDKGPGFIATDVAGALAALNIPLIHGRTRYPQGHGKIEAFNKHVRPRLLGGLRRPDVDPDLGALGLRVEHDAFQVYNHLPHESLDQDTPQMRWSACERVLRPIDDGRLTQAFTIVEPRLVSNDHIIQFGGELWEAPRGLDGETVEVHRRLLDDDALYVVHRGELVRLSHPDLGRNATSHRGKLKDPNPAPDAADEHPAPKTASTMAFEKAFNSMTDADGGYPASPPDNQE
jgi:transposase InsO family protein